MPWRHVFEPLQAPLYWGFPLATAGIGVYLAYRATQMDGAMSTRAFVIGVVMILGTWAWTASRSARHKSATEKRHQEAIQAVRAEVTEVRSEVTEVRSQLNAIQLTIDTHGAATVVLEAVQRTPDDVHWPPLREDETSAAIVPLERHAEN